MIRKDREEFVFGIVKGKLANFIFVHGKVMIIFIIRLFVIVRKRDKK